MCLPTYQAPHLIYRKYTSAYVYIQKATLVPTLEHSLQTGMCIRLSLRTLHSESCFLPAVCVFIATTREAVKYDNVRRLLARSNKYESHE